MVGRVAFQTGRAHPVVLSLIHSCPLSSGGSILTTLHCLTGLCAAVPCCSLSWGVFLQWSAEGDCYLAVPGKTPQ